MKESKLIEMWNRIEILGTNVQQLIQEMNNFLLLETLAEMLPLEASSRLQKQTLNAKRVYTLSL